MQETNDEELPLQEAADKDIEVLSENDSEELPLQETLRLYQGIILKSYPCEKLVKTSKFYQRIILKSYHCEKLVKTSKFYQRMILKSYPCRKLTKILTNSEELPLQEAEDVKVISENQEVIDDNEAVLDNSSGLLDVTRDPERLAQVNNKEMKLQVHVHEDPLLAAKQNSLGRPKRKIPTRKVKAVKTGQRTNYEHYKTSQENMRTLQCCDDVMNKVCTFMAKFSIK